MSPQCTFVLLTWNRREPLLRSLSRLEDYRRNAEVIVVDNASEDGTAEVVNAVAPWVRVIRRSRNEGSVARNEGIRAAQGRFIVLLDDDSVPEPGTPQRAMAYLDAHRDVALVGGRVLLPDGSQDAAAFPLILPACAWIMRRDAFLQSGGFPDDLFMAAEEYDVIFRLLCAGWDVRRFEDLRFRHEKVRQSRHPPRIAGLDLRNNLILAHRFLPPRYRDAYASDWRQRYEALARFAGCPEVIDPALQSAAAWASRYPEGHAARRVLTEPVFERVFAVAEQHRTISAWAEAHRVRRVMIAGYSKNLYATLSGCRAAGLDVVHLADDHPAFNGLVYRGHRVVSVDEGVRGRPDGIVLSTINPARVERDRAQLLQRTTLPVLTLWKPAFLDGTEHATAGRAPAPARAAPFAGHGDRDPRS